MVHDVLSLDKVATTAVKVVYSHSKCPRTLVEFLPPVLFTAQLCLQSTLACFCQYILTLISSYYQHDKVWLYSL